METTQNDLKKFMVEVKHANETRVHTATNSYDTKDFYRDYIKGLDRNSQYFISEKKYGEILRVTHDLLTERLLDGYQVVFPYNFGSLQIEGFKNVFRFVDGKMRTSHMVDWNETLKLWYEDEECRKNKTLVRNDNPNRYIVKFHKSKGQLANKYYLCFMPCRRLTNKINKKMKEEGINVLQMIKYGTTN